MATDSLKKRLTDLFNPITNPGGGLPANSPLSAYLAASKTKAPVFQNPAPVTPYTPTTIDLKNPPSGPMTPIPAADRARIAATAPAAPATPGVPSAGVGPVFAGPSRAPVGPQGSTGAAPASQSPIPPQWLRADGTIKTPEEIANEVGGTLAAAHGQGDVGKLALEQFGTNGKSYEELQADARRIGNTRNDIAVGETDPYKVAKDSGVAYTPAELQAIEKAYAGIYDPALDTALSKAQSKLDADNAAAAAEAKNNEPFTLSKDQVRYDAQGNPIAVGLSDTAPGGSGATYVRGSNATVDAYVDGFRNGVYKASDIPDDYKSLVAQGVAQTKPSISKSSNDAISVINEIAGSDIIEQIAGVPNVSTFLPGTKAQTLLNLTKQLKGLLSLENRQQLKGSGAISDFEFRVLGEAASALGIGDGGRTNLSKDEFINQLNKLKLKLQVGETELTDDELLYLQSKGYSPDEIRDYGDHQAFSTVGNTTASTGQGNRPQRNNNPGNVKAGGAADSLAVGKDDQGHLIFPDAATGFKALTGDLTAKINGASRYLPPNPTIAQLGKVYAEDPNWPKKVAQILGVTIDTHTKAVPLDKLVKAVATQEGFYA